jgi:hypothetical protein
MSKVSNGTDLDDDFDGDDFDGDDDDDFDGDEDDDSLPGDDDTIILSEESLKDQESDTADTAIRRITAHVPRAPKAGSNARRRVEDYLEMRRAARELSDLEDFDLE